MPLPDHLVRDPRIKRTRQLLQDGLRRLLRRRPLDEILVQEITEESTVNRATFYDHYGDKFDLFNAMIAADFRKLLDQRNVHFDGTCSSGLAAIVYAVSDYLQQLHREQVQCTRPASTGPLVDAAVTLAVRDVLLEGLKNERSSPLLPCEVVASMVSGAIYWAVKEWMHRTNWQADEVAMQAVVQQSQQLIGRCTGLRQSGDSGPSSN
jgi:AcrR family transcriptional regulator